MAKVTAKQMCEIHKGKGTMMLVLGLLVLANAYWNVTSWPIFIGAVLAIGGICKMAMCAKK